MAERYIVQGYEFSSKEEALEGKKELAAVKVLSEKVEKGTLENALDIYEKLLEQKLFHTQVGIDYLKSLKQYLADNDVIRDTTLDGLNRKVDQLTEELASEKKQFQKKTSRLKELLYSSLILNLILIIVVAVMIFISSTSNNATILNYENEMQDRYAGWEAELESREAALNEREQSIAAQER
jgi:hypothetical protein